MTSKFLPYPGATFSEADVENYLEELSEKGWRVYKDRNEYIVVINDGSSRRAQSILRRMKHSVQCASFNSLDIPKQFTL